MPRTRYDALTQCLHWLTAMLVLVIYAIGFGREFLPKGEFKAALLMSHMSLGLACLMLVCVRVFWRLTAAPIIAAETRQSAHIAARLTHMGLYVLMILVPVVGLLAAWIKGRTVGFFGFPLENPFAVDVPLGKFLEHFHGYAAHGMMMLVGVHSFAALGHHYFLKDGVLNRMLPARMES